MTFWIHLAARRHPDRVAIEGPERNLTYAQLSQAAISAARTLGRLELEPGARVALALPAPEELVIALHGCILSGHAAVPVDLRLSEAERAHRLAGASVVVSEPLAESERWSGMPSVSGAEQPVAVMHTSGTTAAPKPVELTSANWLASALGSAVALGLDPAERWLCPMPLVHVGGLSIPIRSAIYATTAVLHGHFDTEAVLAELMDPSRRTTLVSLVPTMLARLLDAGLQRPPALRWALLGGGPIAPALLHRAEQAGVPVAPTYGMTEACSQIATHGWPLPGAEIWTSSGEVIVRGPMVSAGALADDGWLHTGDLGSFDQRSRLRITGRIADTIVTGGENVAPAEVEAVLLEHPAVSDAAVFGRPDAEWGEAVSALVVLRASAAVDGAALRAHCSARLAPFKVPKAFTFAERLPRSVTGKLLRRELATSDATPTNATCRERGAV
jgi:O-succinylbenzoic acid--CoA ligase